MDEATSGTSSSVTGDSVTKMVELDLKVDLESLADEMYREYYRSLYGRKSVRKPIGFDKLPDGSRQAWCDAARASVNCMAKTMEDAARASMGL